MAKRILYISSIEKHILRFHLPSLQWWVNNGYEVYVACNGLAEIPFVKQVFQIGFVRQPLSFGHIKAYFQLKELLSREHFDVIHCHTAAASVITRLAAQQYRKKGITKVIYTAHGFHFFKGSPISHWILYFPLEKYFSKYLDCLITINKEDYNLAIKHFHTPLIKRISGMGVDKERFKKLSSEERISIRQNLGIGLNDKVIIYVAEFIHRKNHEFLIRALIQIKELVPDIKLILCGRGILFEEIKKLVEKLNLEEFVFFAGFRNDVEKVIGASDIGVSSSRQEGLGLHLIEALMCGLPVVASSERGHKEIILPGENGFLYTQNSVREFSLVLQQLFQDKELYEKLSLNSNNSVRRFELKCSLKELDEIFSLFK